VSTNQSKNLEKGIPSLYLRFTIVAGHSGNRKNATGETGIRQKRNVTPESTG
jgi:hypothetical protein